MLTQMKIVLTAAVIVGAASAALAKDNGPPKIDIQRACRESSASSTGLPGNADQDLKACVSDEQAAREQLAQNWASYPAPDKAGCLKPQDFLPSYVEWQTCVELKRDLVKMRQDQAASARAESHATVHSSDRRSSSTSR